VNPLTRPIEAAGFSIDRSPPHWTKQAFNVEFSAADQAEYGRAFRALEERLEEAAKTGIDRPASELMEPDGRWNGLLNAFSSYYNGAEFDQVSVLDYAAYVDSGVNWRVSEGYGAAIARLAANAPVRLSTTVEVVVLNAADLIRLRTDQGVLEARAVIVAVPTAVLAREGLRFDPALPDKTAAAQGLPLGLADKVVLGLTEIGEIPAEGHLFGDPRGVRGGSYHLRPFGRPLIEGFFGGRHAWALEAEGPGAFAAFAVEEIVRLLGSDYRARLVPLSETHWGADPFAGGSYSHALPGHAGDRAILAAPVQDRVFFAGEACSPNYFSTAHGAWLTGETAADLALVALRSGR
jgi:monoamine oxidase